VVNQPSSQAAAGDGEVSTRKQIVKLAIELGPVIVFFLTNSYGDRIAKAFPTLAALGGPIFIATAAFMIAVAASLAASYALHRRLPVMPLVTGVFVLIFGGLTLWLQNETFIKMKPTIVNTMFGVTLLGGLLFGKSLLRYIFADAFRLDEEGWRVLTLRWGLFFFALALLNEVVWRNFSTDSWVAFKTFGIMPLTMIFAMSQIGVLMRHRLEPEQAGPKIER
jgi:intracellular septation protein